jgi:hypothetical protein
LSTRIPANQSAISPRRRAIFESLRADTELLRRLRVTQKELDTLERCSLLGAVTCKQDFLFMLRQIREAGIPSGHEEIAALGGADSWKIKPVKTVRKMQRAMRRNAFMTASSSESGWFGQMILRRQIEQFGVLICVLPVFAYLMWNLLTGVYAWRRHFQQQFGAAQCPAPIVQTTAPRQVPPLGSARL